MALQIDVDTAWRYNKKLIDQYKYTGTNDEKHLIMEFEVILNKYAEQSLDWDDTVGSIVADADDAASRASANQLLDSFNRTRSMYHNKLIEITTNLDNLFMENDNERMCNYPRYMSASDLKREDNRKLITDAAFSYYTQTHPNDKLENKTVQWVRKTDMELHSTSKLDFKSEIKNMQTMFNNLPSDYKMVTYNDHALFINTNPEAKSNFKLYSPLELATHMNETNEYSTHTPYEQSVILATLLYSDVANSLPYMRDKDKSVVTTQYHHTKENIIDLLGKNQVHEDVKSYAAKYIQKWEMSNNNINCDLTSKPQYQISHVLLEQTLDMTEGLNELNQNISIEQ